MVFLPQTPRAVGVIHWKVPEQSPHEKQLSNSSYADQKVGIALSLRSRSGVAPQFKHHDHSLFLATFMFASLATDLQARPIRIPRSDAHCTYATLPTRLLIHFVTKAKAIRVKPLPTEKFRCIQLSHLFLTSRFLPT